MLFLISNYQVLKVVETEAQAFYWADILAPNSDYYVNDITVPALFVYNEPELRTIYRNLAGYDAKENWPRETLEGAVLHQVFQLEADSTTVEALHKRLGREPLAPAVTGPAPSESRPTASTGATSTEIRGRAGGQRDIIFAAADEAWEKLGKPTDLSVVRKMRVEVMNTLERQGVKRTTASTTLGAWQKLNIVG